MTLLCGVIRSKDNATLTYGVFVCVCVCRQWLLCGDPGDVPRAHYDGPISGLHRVLASLPPHVHPRLPAATTATLQGPYTLHLMPGRKHALDTHLKLVCVFFFLYSSCIHLQGSHSPFYS